MDEQERVILRVDHTDLAEHAEEQDEVQAVLKALRGLANQISSPVIRVCLEEAFEDIAHLVQRDDEQQDRQTDEGADQQAVA